MAFEFSLELLLEKIQAEKETLESAVGRLRVKLAAAEEERSRFLADLRNTTQQIRRENDNLPRSCFDLRAFEKATETLLALRAMRIRQERMIVEQSRVIAKFGFQIEDRIEDLSDCELRLADVQRERKLELQKEQKRLERQAESRRDDDNSIRFFFKKNNTET